MPDLPRCAVCGHILPGVFRTVATQAGARVVCVPCDEGIVATVLGLRYDLPLRKVGNLLPSLRDNGEGPGAALANLIIGGVPPWER